MPHAVELRDPALARTRAETYPHPGALPHAVHGFSHRHRWQVVSATADRVDQSVYFVEKRNKPTLLAHYLDQNGVTRMLVFTRTKHGADRVAKHLVKNGVRAQAIHGNKSQNARNRAMADFKSGKPPVLVATDIAARGLDIDDVSHVVNYDLPNVPEKLTRRSIPVREDHPVYSAQAAQPQRDGHSHGGFSRQEPRREARGSNRHDQGGGRSRGGHGGSDRRAPQGTLHAPPRPAHRPHPFAKGAAKGAKSSGPRQPLHAAQGSASSPPATRARPRSWPRRTDS